MSLLTLLANFAAAALLAVVFLASGARIRRLLRLPFAPAERWAADLVLGAFAGGIWILGLGLVDLLAPFPLAIGLVLQGLVGRWRHNSRPIRTMAIAAVAGLPNLPTALGPPHFYDAMVYHLGLPWQALQDGAWLAHGENVFAGFPPLAQFVSTPLLAVGLFSAPALLHLFAWAAAAVAAGSLARRLGATELSADLLVAAAMLLPVTPLVPGFPAAEGWFLAAILPAVGAAVLPNVRNNLLPGASLLLGTSCAFRLQGITWVAIVLLVWTCSSRRLTAVLHSLPWVLIGAAPWWLKNALLLRDPVAPLLWRREGMETLWRDGASLVNLGLTPIEILLEIPRHLAGAGPILASILLGAAVAAAMRARLRPALWIAALSLVAWGASGALLRFFAPTLVLLLITIAAWDRARIPRLVSAGLLILSLVAGGVAQARWLLLLNPIQTLTLRYDEAAFLTAPNPPFKAYRNLESFLPGDARLMVIGDARGVGLPRPFVVTSQHDPNLLRSVVEIGDATGINRHLREIGVTHVVINTFELQRLSGTYPVAPWRTSRGEVAWWRFVRSLGPPISDEDGVRTLEVEAAPRRNETSSEGGID